MKNQNFNYLYSSMSIDNHNRVYLLWEYLFLAIGLLLLIKTFLYYLYSNSNYNNNVIISNNKIYFYINNIELLLSLTYLIENLLLYFSLFLVLLIFILNFVVNDDQTFNLSSGTILKIILLTVLWNFLGIFSSPEASVINSLEINLKIFLEVILATVILKTKEEDIKKNFNFIKIFGFFLGFVSIIFFVILLIASQTLQNDYYDYLYNNYLIYFDFLIGLIYITMFIVLKLKLKLFWGNYSIKEVKT